MKKKTLELLKSGNFTIAYHDSGCASIYKGHLKYDDLPEEGEVDMYDSGSNFDYIPGEVEALVKALGGKVVSV